MHDRIKVGSVRWGGGGTLGWVKKGVARKIEDEESLGRGYWGHVGLRPT